MSDDGRVIYARLLLAQAELAAHDPGTRWTRARPLGAMAAEMLQIAIRVYQSAGQGSTLDPRWDPQHAATTSRDARTAAGLATLPAGSPRS